MKTSPIQIIKDIIKMTLATIIVGSSVFLFREPSHAAVSSVSGLSIVLTNFMPFSVAQITMFLNVTLLVIGFFTCGHSFGIKTVYTSILLPIVIRVYEKLLPNYTSMTGDATLDVVCYIFTVSIGIAMLFNMNASSGGIDIIAMILNKYLHIELGKALGAAGLVIALSSALAYDGKTVVLSLLGSYLNGFIVDHYIFDHDMKRRVCIVSPKEEEIRNYILHELKSGATIYKAFGAYRMEEHNEIIAIVNKSEYQKLMTYLHEIDPQAFITVYTVSEMHYRSKLLEERKWE